MEFLREKSPDVRLFLEQFLSAVRDSMLAHLSSPEFPLYARIFEIFESVYSRVKFTSDPFILLETSTFRLIGEYGEVPVHALQKPTTTPVVTGKVAPVVSSPKVEVKEPIAQVVAAENMEKIPMSSSSDNPSSFDFSRFVEYVRSVPKRSFVGL